MTKGRLRIAQSKSMLGPESVIREGGAFLGAVERLQSPTEKI